MAYAGRLVEKRSRINQMLCMSLDSDYSHSVACDDTRRASRSSTTTSRTLLLSSRGSSEGGQM